MSYRGSEELAEGASVAFEVPAHRYLCLAFPCLARQTVENPRTGIAVAVLALNLHILRREAQFLIQVEHPG